MGGRDEGAPSYDADTGYQLLWWVARRVRGRGATSALSGFLVPLAGLELLGCRKLMNLAAEEAYRLGKVEVIGHRFVTALSLVRLYHQTLPL